MMEEAPDGTAWRQFPQKREEGWMRKIFAQLEEQFLSGRLVLHDHVLGVLLHSGLALAMDQAYQPRLSFP